jgi:hypothetical protein
MKSVDCPACLDHDRAVRCGLPAEVRCRYMVRSTGGGRGQLHACRWSQVTGLLRGCLARGPKPVCARLCSRGGLRILAASAGKEIAP